jgi:hypothetical protein
MSIAPLDNIYIGLLKGLIITGVFWHGNDDKDVLQVAYDLEFKKELTSTMVQTLKEKSNIFTMFCISMYGLKNNLDSAVFEESIRDIVDSNEIIRLSNEELADIVITKMSINRNDYNLYVDELNEQLKLMKNFN